MLRVYLFGGLRVDVEGRVILPEHWARSRIARKLFCRLALAPRHRLHRDELVDALWGERLPTDPDNRLSQEASNVQRILTGAPGTEPRYVQREGQLIVLSPDEPLWTDVEAFSRLAREALSTRDAAAYETVVERYGSADHGNVLLPEYCDEPWVARRQLELRDTYGTLLVQLARLRAADNRLQDAEQALKRLLAEMPAHEEAHRGLMCLYAQFGQRDRAVRQFRRLHEELQREFGTDISPESAALFQRIAMNQLAGTALPSGAAAILTVPRTAPTVTESLIAALSVANCDSLQSSRPVASNTEADAGAVRTSHAATPAIQADRPTGRSVAAQFTIGIIAFLLVSSVIILAYSFVRPNAAKSETGLPPSLTNAASEIQVGNILLQDDLSDAINIWELLPPTLRDLDPERIGYNAGELYMVKPAGYRLNYAAISPEVYEDFYAEVDARAISIDMDAQIYIAFRRQFSPRPDDYYMFAIYPNDGTYSLSLSRNVEQPDAGPPAAKIGTERSTLLARKGSPAIHRSDARNRIAVLANGPEIALFVNGQMLASLRDATYRRGRFTLAVGGPLHSRVEGRFTNLVVRAVE